MRWGSDEGEDWSLEFKGRRKASLVIVINRIFEEIKKLCS